jgi:hypothetical protein
VAPSCYADVMHAIPGDLTLASAAFVIRPDAGLSIDQAEQDKTAAAFFLLEDAERAGLQADGTYSLMFEDSLSGG